MKNNKIIQLPFAEPFTPKKTEKDFIEKFRKECFEVWNKNGVPSRKNEPWRYTRLDKLVSADLKVKKQTSAKPEITEKFSDVYRFVFIDGRLDKESSFNGEMPAGVTACLLENCPDVAPEWLLKQFGKTVVCETNSFAALNGAMFEDCFVLRLADDVVLDRPVHIISFSSSGAVSNPRFLVRVGFGSSLTLIEEHIGEDGQPYFSNSVTEAYVREGGKYRHYKHQSEQKNSFHIANIKTFVESRAVYENFVLQTGGLLARNELDIELIGERAEVKADGAYRTEGQQHMDYTVYMNHDAADTRSSQVCKGVLDDSSKAVFQSKILVERDSQRIEGNQLHKALLLSEKAEVDCKPALEIYADDVKCSHGATVGELDEEQMFYLRARGIDEETARNLLIEAFLDDVINDISEKQVRSAFLEVVKKDD